MRGSAFNDVSDLVGEAYNISWHFSGAATLANAMKSRSLQDDVMQHCAEEAEEALEAEEDA